MRAMIATEEASPIIQVVQKMSQETAPKELLILEAAAAADTDRKLLFFRVKKEAFQPPFQNSPKD